MLNHRITDPAFGTWKVFLRNHVPLYSHLAVEHLRNGMTWLIVGDMAGREEGTGSKIQDTHQSPSTLGSCNFTPKSPSPVHQILIILDTRSCL